MSSRVALEPPFALPEGGTAHRVEAMDWVSGSVGPPAQWPPLLRAAVELCLSSATPAAVCWGPELSLICNDALLDMIGDPDGDVLGRPLCTISSKFGRLALKQVRKVQASGSAETLVFKDKTIASGDHANGRHALTCVLLRNPDKSVAGYLLYCSEVSSLVGVDRGLREREQRLRLALHVGRLAIFDLDVKTKEFTWTDEMYGMLGYKPGEIKPSYAAITARIHPDDLPIVEAAAAVAESEHRLYSHEYRIVLKDGATRWVSVQGQYFYDETGAAERVIGVMRDTTERHMFQETQKILIAELQHRTRNLMGVVGAIAEKTARSSVDLADFQSRFSARLDALARVQRLLSDLSENRRVTFDQLIRSELLAVAGSLDRVSLRGPPDVPLRSSTLQTLAMAIHELATNAVKYGALGQAQARLDVTWSLQPAGESGQPWLNVDWRESGVVMPDAESPRGTGQGRQLIERALPFQLKAKTTYELGSDGVHCTMALPISATPMRDGADA